MVLPYDASRSAMGAFAVVGYAWSRRRVRWGLDRIVAPLAGCPVAVRTVGGGDMYRLRTFGRIPWGQISCGHIWRGFISRRQFTSG